ncbi:chaperone protein DNAK, putative [Entamoeba dispar SAW760]|uniref:Chaperone protein DNAK, putative n=1 Tax=Entamoeba dispar (strain ATCC PRA-260 / SAW760) TaxID=370354 RepID=B0EP81_ENTDS|nr:chaperone protein DNAK, putative [Entamoeba dispar SAW760]EDR23652.1 chaperone protein DNAK, putative [Entamoeba dispar SAW760]|eukprot:EDR23652.1 chaperone protein DNAK, putative [Entamoeba dispar SAW760]
MAVEENSFSIGIDLGTTFSSVAYYDPVKGEPVVLQDESGKEQVASWISISQFDKSGYTLIGSNAKSDINTECAIYDSKRIIGRDESDVSYDDREHWPFKIKGKDNGSAYIQQCPISNVVVTVPVDFNDRQREATLLACKLAGIKNVELANEPTAAIAGYKRENPNSLKNGDKVVLIDFGGGTLDVSCCKIVNDNIIVESSGGNQNLGGNDFDNVMTDIIKERIEDGIPGYYEKKQGMTQKEKIALNKKLVRLKKESEKIKIELSGKTDSELDLEFLLSDNNDEILIEPTITRKEFEEECKSRGLYEEFINKIKQVTQKKGYKKGNVQLVLLIGGTCKMPKIIDEVASLFDRQTFADKNFNPLTAVAKGAAYLAYSKQSECVGHKIVYDIVPTPIGIEIIGGIFEILIKEGETLPTTGATKQYYTTKDNQTSAKFNIYKGFGKYISSIGMEFITTLRVDGIPSGKAGEQSFEFTIKVNENGMMEISASVVGSDIKKDLIVSVDLSKKEEGEIAKLMEHFQTFY